jgi:hypothetical protein
MLAFDLSEYSMCVNAHFADHSIISEALERPYIVVGSDVGRKCKEHGR